MATMSTAPRARTISAKGFGEASVSVLADSRVVAPEKRDPNNPATWGKVGRNEACPCGSGKKYKHCHGAFA